MCSNIQQIESKTGLTGDGLIGYRGFCYKCGQERRIYWIQCRDDIRRFLNDRDIKRFKSFCEVCLMERRLKDTVTEWYRMPRYQVDKDLYILGEGLDIDFDKAESDKRENEKNDYWWENMNGKVEEYKKRKKLI